MLKINKREFGQKIEEAAARHLKKNGLKLITNNFHCKAGEIDLIMQDSKALVFVEVRYRQHHQYGRGSETVTRSKQQKVIKAALYFLQQEKKYNRMPCRFDVIDVSPDGDRHYFDWIKDAFQTTHFF